MAVHARRREPKWDDDPLVPIDPIRVRAAIQAKNWNNHAVAKKLGEKSQTLDNLTKGERGQMKATRLQRRAKLAVLLDVSEEWLGGTEDLLEDLRRVPRELTLSLSPRMQLAVTAFLTKANRAYLRDLHAFGVVDKAIKHSTRSGAVTGFFDWCLLRLLRLDAWQEQLTTWRKADLLAPTALFDAPGLLNDRTDLYTEADDAFGVAMTAAWTALLQPWFEGNAQLDYNRLRVLVGYDRLGKDPKGMSHPRYLGAATDPRNLRPEYALGWPTWANV